MNRPTMLASTPPLVAVLSDAESRRADAPDATRQTRRIMAKFSALLVRGFGYEPVARYTRESGSRLQARFGTWLHRFLLVLEHPRSGMLK